MFHFPKREEVGEKQLGAVQISLIQYFWLFLGNFRKQIDFSEFELIGNDFEPQINDE